MSRVLYLGLILSLAAFVDPMAAQSRSVIEHVLVHGNAEAAEIEVLASGPPVAPNTQVVTGPDRIIVDFPDAVPSAELRALRVNLGALKGIRSGLFCKNPPTTRIVLDLTQARTYIISPTQHGVVIKLGAAKTPQSDVLYADNGKVKDTALQAHATLASAALSTAGSTSAAFVTERSPVATVPAQNAALAPDASASKAGATTPTPPASANSPNANQDQIPPIPASSSPSPTQSLASPGNQSSQSFQPAPPSKASRKGASNAEAKPLKMQISLGGPTSVSAAPADSTVPRPTSSPVAANTNLSAPPQPVALNHTNIASAASATGTAITPPVASADTPTPSPSDVPKAPEPPSTDAPQTVAEAQPPSIFKPGEPSAPADAPKPVVNVSYENGLLSIHAEKATLSQVLFEVHLKTGAEIAIPAGAEQEQVAVSLGPAPARDVLGALLNGSPYNFIFLGSETSLERVILTRRDPANF